MSIVLKNRMEWVEHMRLGLLRAIEEDVMDPVVKVFPTVDPIRVILKITLVNPIAKASRLHMRRYLRAWAEKHNCEIPQIEITDRWVQGNVLIKHRHWKPDVEEEHDPTGCRP
jgi:hypothetical protein